MRWPFNFGNKDKQSPPPTNCKSKRKVTQEDLHELEQRTNMKISELAANLTALTNLVTKINVEVQALKNSLSDVELPPEATAALDNLTTALKGVDDINPDAA